MYGNGLNRSTATHVRLSTDCVSVLHSSQATKFRWYETVVRISNAIRHGHPKDPGPSLASRTCHRFESRLHSR